VQIHYSFPLEFVQALQVNSVEINVVWVLIKDIDKGVDLLVGHDPVLISKVIEHFFEFIEVLHASDFPTNDLVVKVCQESHKEGQDDVVDNEHHGQ
jgi:hypothetical protein